MLTVAVSFIVNSLIYLAEYDPIYSFVKTLENFFLMMTNFEISRFVRVN